MAPMTKQQQYRRISAGFALGLIMNNRYQLPSNKPHTEFAFTAAWRKWAYCNSYSWMQRVATGAVKDLDVIHIMTELDKNKSDPHMPFYWDSRAPAGPTIYAREHSDFDPSDNSDLEFYAEGLNEVEIPAKAWTDLAKSFLENLGRD